MFSLLLTSASKLLTISSLNHIFESPVLWTFYLLNAILLQSSLESQFAISSVVLAHSDKSRYQCSHHNSLWFPNNLDDSSIPELLAPCSPFNLHNWLYGHMRICLSHATITFSSILFSKFCFLSSFSLSSIFLFQQYYMDLVEAVIHSFHSALFSHIHFSPFPISLAFLSLVLLW